jgi:hypothetical protein
MSLRIGEDAMTSQATTHRAWRVSDPTTPAQQWQVSWLPGRALTRNQAITAMTLAENYVVLASAGHAAVLAAWAAELDLSPDAVAAALMGRSAS